MPDSFIDRADELKALERAWTDTGARLILVWGRRRTGKTRLLGRFVSGKRAVFYGATQQSSAAELGGLSEAVRRVLPPQPTDVLAHGDFTSWDAALGYLAARARRERLAVVLDEFPFLVEAEPALPSILQRFWDHTGRSTKLRLILCGSAISTMERLQTDRAPLFGRIDVRLHLRPFEYAEAGLFVPKLSPVQRAIAYSTMGGMPVYLSRWRDDRGHKANLRALFGDPRSPLVDEGEYVLMSELPEGSGYFRILHAIASGHRTYGKIRTFADIEIQRQLERLIELGLVRRIVPITENPDRTKRVVYRIGDNFLTFWFRFVYRHRPDIARGLGREIVDRSILPALGNYMGDPWEDMCRAYLVRGAGTAELGVRLSAVGSWWNPDHSIQIDIVGLDGRKVVLAGSAKWAKRLPPAELDRLRRAAEALPRRAQDLTFVLFARDRVDVSAPDVLTFTAPDIYR